MLVVTTSYVEGKEIHDVLGLVKGSVVTSNLMGKAMVAGVRRLVGKETMSSEGIMIEARERAIVAMVEEAEKLGANAVVDVKLAVHDLPGDTTEILAYGTAIKIA